MKDPLNTAKYLDPLTPAQRRRLYDLSPKHSDKAGTSETFISLMSDILEKGKNADTALSSLDKNCLQRLINAVRLQMNEYLLTELGDINGGGQDAGAFNLQRRWLNDYGTGNDTMSVESNIKPEPRKTDAPASPFPHKSARPAQRVSKPDGGKAELDEIIKHASDTYGVDPDLITSVIQAESDFDAGATSSRGAMGLMQLMPATAKELGVKNCYNPAENIMAGTRYLKSLLNRYDGNIDLTLAAYNWGMGNVERHPDRLPQETRTYIARVSRLLQDSTS